jgi:acyl-CoA carboxylase subunit beta
VVMPYDHLVDEGSFRAHEDDLSSRDPIAFTGYQDALAEARPGSIANESIVCGAAEIAGHAVELAAFDFTFLGGSMGEVTGERLARAMERAAETSRPFILRTATGGARMQEGMRSLVQMPKLVSARAALARAHVPYIAVLGDPTTGGVLASVGALADYTIAESGATIGFAGPRVVKTVTGSEPSAGSHTAASAFAHGLVDSLCEPDEIRGLVTRALEVLAPDTPRETGAPSPAGSGAADGWDAVSAGRDPQRPTAPDLARAAADAFLELRGDRGGQRDDSVFAAIARVKGRRVVIIALDRTKLIGPGAFRTARRCLSLATRLGIPVVTFVDTRGADPSEESEARGIAWEIAALFDAVLGAAVPVISIITGEGGSGGALAFACGDVLLAYEHSFFSVIGPEAAASILWRDAEKAPEAARTLKLTATDLRELGIADGLLAEPPDGGSVADAVAYHLDLMQPITDRSSARLARWRHI